GIYLWGGLYLRRELYHPSPVHDASHRGHPLPQGERERNQEDDLTRPFEGVKILDFTQVLAGPYASYQLALLGADVIKIERRGGEDMRRTPLSREWADRNFAPAFPAVNGNKRSLTLDLSKPDAISIVKKLAV